MRAHSLFCHMVPPFEKVTKKRRQIITFFNFVLLYMNILLFVICKHFTTLKWLQVLKLSKICLKMIKAMTSKTTEQNILFLNEWIPFVYTVDLTSVVSNYLSLLITEPRQANLCLRAFRHDKFQLRMPSHSAGPGIWLSVSRFLLIHCLYERAAKVLARLRGCAGSPEPSLLA